MRNPVRKNHAGRGGCRAHSVSHLFVQRWVSLYENFPAGLYPDIAHAIGARSFSAGITPQTNGAKIGQDVDRPEALGAIGLARVFYA